MRLENEERIRMAKSNRKLLYGLIAAVFWLLVWQLVSMAVGSNVILPGPVRVVKALAGLIVTGDFWRTVGTSFMHIILGFIGAVAVGIALAILSAACTPVEIIVTPLMRLIKAVPVASFIILVLLWVSSGIVPAVISFLMVLPVIYINVLTGIGSADVQLLEMAKVFRMSSANKVKHIYVPAVTPHFVSAMSVGLGFCWKSGVAAEVIALSTGSIGRRLYDAKLYLMTDELFAWTVVIVVVSVVFEKIVMTVVKRLVGAKKA